MAHDTEGITIGENLEESDVMSTTLGMAVRSRIKRWTSHLPARHAHAPHRQKREMQAFDIMLRPGGIAGTDITRVFNDYDKTPVIG